MVEVLRVLLAAVVVASLCVIVAYVVGFVVLSVVSLRRRGRSDPLAGDLDQVLDELLASRPLAEAAVQRSRAGRR